MFIQEGFYLRKMICVFCYSLDKLLDFEAYKERFSEDNVEIAFLYLVSKLEALWSESDFFELQKICKRDYRLSHELKSNLINATKLEQITDLLINSPLCNWLELRILQSMATVADIPEAIHMIKAFEDCVHKRKCSEVREYLKERYINPDHLTLVIAKVNQNGEEMVVADLIKYCRLLESALGLPDNSSAAANIQKGCLEIKFYIPTYSYLHAYEVIKSNFLQLRPMHIQYLQIGTYPKVFATNLHETSGAQILSAKLSSVENCELLT